MTFEGLLELTHRRIITIAAGLVVGLVIGIGFVWLYPVSYKASADAYVRAVVPANDTAPNQADEYYSASQLATQKVKAFVPVFTSEAVAQGVIDTLGLDTTPAALSRSVSATNEDDTLTITVTVTAPTAEDARIIVDEVIRQSAEQVRRLEGEDSPVAVVPMSPSGLSTTSRSPSILSCLGLGALGGVLLGYALALARQASDRRVRSAAVAAAAAGRPVLGALPYSEAVAEGRDAPQDADQFGEALRKLRTNLRYANVDAGLHSFVISAPQHGDGTSVVSSNLARVMALTGQEVVLINGDLRQSTPGTGPERAERHPGLSELLAGTVTLEAVLLPTSVPGLQLIPAGEIPPNPSELLGSERMSDVVTRLSSDRVVIIDTPPVLPVTDAVALAPHTDGVLVVARSGRTTKDQLSHVAESIRQGGGCMLGVILNHAPQTAS